MLNLFLISMLMLALFFVLMAVGVMSGREPLKGSCGGLNKLGMRDGDCPVCGGVPDKCESNAANTLARDAMKK